MRDTLTTAGVGVNDNLAHARRAPLVKSLPTLGAVTLLSMCNGACGNGSRYAGSIPYALPKPDVSSGATSTTGHELNDGDDGDDADNHNIGGDLNDDREVTYYGHAARTDEARTASAIAGRYFKAAAAENGAAACLLLLPRLAHTIPEAYGKDRNATYLRGNTCAEVMTKLFMHRHYLMTAEDARLKVTGVRATTTIALVLLSFGGVGKPGYLEVARIGDTWKLDALLDSEYP